VTSSNHLLDLSAAWLLYFLLHSFLASLKSKRWLEMRWPGLLPWYRIAFNVVALVLLAFPLWLLYSQPGELLIEWSGYLQWLSHLIALLVFAGFLWSTRYYDGDEFLGLKQAREKVRQVEDQESFHISPLHRYVRHPWYFLGLLLIWSRDMDAGFLLSAIMITIYIVIGSRLEEKKLGVYHGPVYQEYTQRVAGLFPLPWKYLTRQQAMELLKQVEKRATAAS